MSSTVKVRGEAAVRAEPDDALLMITLTALEDTPGAALLDVSTRSSALVAMLDRFGVANADRTTTGVGVHEEFDYASGGRRSLGHRAVNQVSVRASRRSSPPSRSRSRSSSRISSERLGPIRPGAGTGAGTDRRPGGRH